MNDEVLQEWEENARYWRQYAPELAQMFSGLTHGLVAAAGIGPSQSVLDVAGGPGEPSLTIAELVGPKGLVTCTDAVAEMVATAEAEARRRGLTNISFRQCAAEQLPFPDDNFDVAVCRLGAMFFPDALGALREMVRVLKPGGVVALAVWHRSDRNPFGSIITKKLARYIPSPPPAPGAYDAFRFAEPGSLSSILKEAGATEVDEQILQFHIAAEISPEKFWELRSATSGSLRQKLNRLSPAERAQLWEDVRAGMSEYFSHGQMDFPAEAVLVSGRKG